MSRKILSVFIGYLIFAMSAALLFILSGHDPHAGGTVVFKYITIAYGVFFSVLAGLMVPLIASTKTLTLNFVLAGLIILVAGISMATSRGDHWTQLFAMIIFAPISVLGGYFKVRKG